MKRWWSLSMLPALALGLGFPVEAPASTQATVSIIMTTIGTDGTTVTQSLDVPSGATLQLQASGAATPTVGVPTAGNTSSPSTAPSGTGSAPGSSASTPPAAPPSAPAAGATGNPTPDS